MRFTCALRGLVAVVVLASVGGCGGKSEDKSGDKAPSVDVEMGAGSTTPSPGPAGEKGAKGSAESNEPVFVPPESKAPATPEGK